MRQAIQGLSDLPGQRELPGTGKDIRGSLQRKANAPLKPSVAQQPCDLGIFSDSRNQVDMLDLLNGGK